jgi:tricarboxylate carrier
MNVFGRMSCQVPGGIALIGAMLIWYRSVSAVIFWQWANQSFNALVNYTNRNAKSPTSPKQLLVAYTMATSAALGSALGCKAYFAKSSSVLLQRMVPFIAVAAANFVNLPLMRQSEFVNGVTVNDELGNPVAKSKYAPAKGIFQVVLSRIAIAAPAMMLVPVVMERLEKEAWFVARRAKLNMPAQLLLTAAILLPSVPGGCALFPQRCSIKLERLKWFDRPEYDRVLAEYGAKGLKLPQRLYFNKGL